MSVHCYYIYICMTIFWEYSVIQAGFAKFNCIAKMHALFGKLFNAAKQIFEFIKCVNILFCHCIIVGNLNSVIESSLG